MKATEFMAALSITSAHRNPSVVVDTYSAIKRQEDKLQRLLDHISALTEEAGNEAEKLLEMRVALGTVR